MFTASHNPGEYNGIKFCLAGAQPITPASFAEIANARATAGPAPAEPPGQRIASRTCCPRTPTICTPWST